MVSIDDSCASPGKTWSPAFRRRSDAGRRESVDERGESGAKGPACCPAMGRGDDNIVRAICGAGDRRSNETNGNRHRDVCSQLYCN